MLVICQSNYVDYDERSSAVAQARLHVKGQKRDRLARLAKIRRVKKMNLLRRDPDEMPVRMIGIGIIDLVPILYAPAGINAVEVGTESLRHILFMRQDVRISGDLQSAHIAMGVLVGRIDGKCGPGILFDIPHMARRYHRHEIKAEIRIPGKINRIGPNTVSAGGSQTSILRRLQNMEATFAPVYGPLGHSAARGKF